MQQSSDCISHFTSSLEKVKTVLADRFRGSYCKEVLCYKEERVPLFIPMISFCDIPVKAYSNLGAIYGKFGIGMNRQWVMAKKLNPVLYIDKNSLLLDNYVKAFRGSQATANVASQILQHNKTPEGAAFVKQITDSIEYIVYALYRTKHYEDNLPKLDNQVYKFYDEREWRYIPEFQCAVCELGKSEQEYTEWRQQSEMKPLLDEVFLEFTLADVEYILVEDRDDVAELIRFINDLPPDRFGDIEKELVFTKVACFQDIQKNF